MGTITVFLTFWAFIESQYFLGAEIVAPVRPADAATRHLRHAQVNGLDLGAVDEYFEQRSRQRQLGNGLESSLNDRHGRCAPVAVCQKLVRSDGKDHVQEGTQDAVRVEAGHRFQCVGEGVLQPLGLRTHGDRTAGIQPSVEQLEQFQCNAGMACSTSSM